METFPQRFVCRVLNQAACRALEQAKEKNIKKLVLYTDSKFTINGESEPRDGETDDGSSPSQTCDDLCGLQV